eukprot:11204834-Lingulodinium_polyedra.AAC.1
MAGYHCLELPWTLNLFLKKARCWKLELVVMSVDIPGAFDAASHTRLFEWLHGRGIPRGVC